MMDWHLAVVCAHACTAPAYTYLNGNVMIVSEYFVNDTEE